MGLTYCPDCGIHHRDPSVRFETYTRKRDNKQCRAEYCTRPGCGWRKSIPTEEELKRKIELKSKQLQFDYMI